MGVTRRIDSVIYYWIMLISGQLIAEETEQHTNCDYMLNPYIAVQIKYFDQALTELLDDTNFTIYDFDSFGMKDEGSDMMQWETCDTEYGDKKTTPTETEYVDMIEELHPVVVDIGFFYKYIGVTVNLDDRTNIGGNIATVKQRAADANGFSTGNAHKKPLLDTR